MAWLAGCRPALALVAVAVGQPMNDMGARLHVRTCEFILPLLSLSLPTLYTYATCREEENLCNFAGAAARQDGAGRQSSSQDEEMVRPLLLP